MNTLLKTAIKSTIAEVRAQKHEEFKAYNQATRLRMRNRLLECGFTDKKVGRILHHHAGIRQNKEPAPQEWIDAPETERLIWHAHRQGTRRTLRAMNLAYGFLSDIPYYVMEPVCYTNPDWEQVIQYVNIYATAADDREHGAQRLEQWLQSAQSGNTVERVRYDVAGHEGQAVVVRPASAKSVTFKPSK